MALHAFLLLLAISLAGGMKSGIIGGEVAKPYSRPYMASVQIGKLKHHTCGGMLIRKDYVLTAAHCLNLSEFSGRDHFEVVLGAQDLSPKNKKSQQRIPVKKYIRHPLFQRNEQKDYSYDIMLLKLKNNAKLDKSVKVMPLPKKNKIITNVKCSIAGWGSITPDGKEATHVMRVVTLKLQENSVCENKWQHYFNPARMICSVSDGHHAFCKGDSGSPLICENLPQGIASYTVDGDCGNTTYPQVYVKIFSFLQWIKKNMK